MGDTSFHGHVLETVLLFVGLVVFGYGWKALHRAHVRKVIVVHGAQFNSAHRARATGDYEHELHRMLKLGVFLFLASVALATDYPIEWYAWRLGALFLICWIGVTTRRDAIWRERVFRCEECERGNSGRTT